MRLAEPVPLTQQVDLRLVLRVTEVGEFLQALEDNDDVQRVWAAVK